MCVCVRVRTHAYTHTHKHEYKCTQGQIHLCSLPPSLSHSHTHKCIHNYVRIICSFTQIETHTHNFNSTLLYHLAELQLYQRQVARQAFAPKPLSLHEKVHSVSPPVSYTDRSDLPWSPTSSLHTSRSCCGPSGDTAFFFCLLRRPAHSTQTHAPTAVPASPSFCLRSTLLCYFTKWRQTRTSELS